MTIGRSWFQELQQLLSHTSGTTHQTQGTRIPSWGHGIWCPLGSLAMSLLQAGLQVVRNWIAKSKFHLYGGWNPLPCFKTGSSGDSSGKSNNLISEVRAFKLREMGAFGFRHLPASEGLQCGKPCNSFWLKSLSFLLSFTEAVLKPFSGTFLLLIAEREMYNIHIIWTCILGLERQRQNLPSRSYKTSSNLLLRQNTHLKITWSINWTKHLTRSS